MLLNSASDELRETFGSVGKLHSIILKSAGLASVMLACCAGQAMADGDAAETIEAAYKQIQP